MPGDHNIGGRVLPEDIGNQAQILSGFFAQGIRIKLKQEGAAIEFIRNLIASIVSDARRRKGGVGDGEFLLPGFNMAKGKKASIATRCIQQNEDMYETYNPTFSRGGND